ncbi:hypothetical protein PIIN_09434 [Serendipita indica DSM 11827]|uniref:Ricin B lectin domain-containing protein n=1 Tax=Serendipita indica (strain DSM 11827) TaxID=1109443 RepID=G4TVV3_SERID|nr:hypothetical protein PIIN_09434 [Serendipita indica DSM 11827]
MRFTPNLLLVASLLASRASASSFTFIQPNTDRLKCLTAPGFYNGARLTFSDCMGGQEFQNIDTESVPGRLSMANGTMCFDVVDGIKSNQTAIQLWECADGNINQMWEFLPTGQWAVAKWKGQDMCMCSNVTSGADGNVTIFSYQAKLYLSSLWKAGFEAHVLATRSGAFT